MEEAFEDDIDDDEDAGEGGNDGMESSSCFPAQSRTKNDTGKMKAKFLTTLFYIFFIVISRLFFVCFENQLI